MTGHGPNHLPFVAFADGLEAAVGRLPSEPTIGGQAAFPAIFEALAWIGAIGDRLLAEKRTIPAVHHGLYYLRNVVLHQGADVLLLIPGVAYGQGRYGAAVYGGAPQRIFPPRSSLQPPISKVGEHEYDHLIAGEDVTGIFKQAVAAARALV